MAPRGISRKTRTLCSCAHPLPPTPCRRRAWDITSSMHAAAFAAPANSPVDCHIIQLLQFADRGWHTASRRMTMASSRM